MNTFMKFMMMIAGAIWNGHWMLKLHELIIQIVALIFLVCEAIEMIRIIVEATVIPIIIGR